MRWVLAFTIFILAPFLEHLFRGAGFVSIFAVMAIVAFSHSKLEQFLAMFIPLSIILDITFHLSIGTHALAISIALSGLMLLNRIFPSDNFMTQGFTVLTTLVVYWIVFSIIFSLQIGSGLSIITLTLFVSALVKAFFGTILYFVGEVILDYTRGDTKSTLKFR